MVHSGAMVSTFMVAIFRILDRHRYYIDLYVSAGDPVFAWGVQSNSTYSFALVGYWCRVPDVEVEAIGFGLSDELCGTLSLS